MTDAIRRDRDGELHAVPDPETLPACICDGSGWAGEDHAGRPRVCLHCRPHLIGRLGERYRRYSRGRTRLRLVR